MKVPFYQVDAFSGELFRGNPAGVCPLKKWLAAEVMQNIAMENNLAETGFFVGQGGEYEIRWFTPEVEVDLCGHATLGSAHVIYNHLKYQGEVIKFSSRSGVLRVNRDGDFLMLDFPANPPEAIDSPDKLEEGLGDRPVKVLKSFDLLAVFEREEEIKALRPNFEILKQLDIRGVIVTAPGQECDFVSRFFAPKVGINEDPVTGSAHTILTPYWAKRLNKKYLVARQLSRRGGELHCEDRGNRILIGGQAVTYLEGTISV